MILCPNVNNAQAKIIVQSVVMSITLKEMIEQNVLRI